MDIENEILFRAIDENNLELIENFVPCNDCSDIRNKFGLTLLHIAVLSNKTEIVKYLIENTDLSIDVKCYEGRTPLFVACENDTIDIKIIEILINCGSNVNETNNDGVSPLHLSCRNGNTELTELLLDKNADILTIDCNGYNCLHFLALSNCLETLKLIMKQNKIDINSVDLEGVTPLMLAVDVANYEMSKKLIQLGADVNITTNNNSALHLAVVTQQVDVFQLLWQKIDFNIIIQLSQTNNLIKLMIKYGWFFPDKIDILLNVLDHKNVLTVLSNDIKIFTILFYRIRFVKYLNEINVLRIVNKLIDIGVTVTQNDLRVFLLNFYKFDTNKFEILHVLVTKGNVNIDDINIMKFVIELYPELVTKLLTFCVKIGPIDVINLFTEILRINKDMIKLVIVMLFFCTPNLTVKRILTHHLTQFCCAILNFEENSDVIVLYNHILTVLKCQKVPSLLEMSRNVVRKKLSKKCHNSRDFLTVINQFEMSNDYIDILKCQIAVNILPNCDINKEIQGDISES